jgi:hypothetical protein
MTGVQVRVAGALVAAAVLVGPSAQAQGTHTPDKQARPSYGHTTNEWLMMGRSCGASMTSS